MKKTMLYLSMVLLALSCTSEESDKNAATPTLSDTIEFSQLSARPTAEGANSAAYFTIVNGTDSADTLAAMESESFKRAELHESYTTEEGLSGMRPVGTIAIPSGDSLTLKPGSYHVMLMQAATNFSSGDSIPLTLKFTRSGSKSLNLPVNRF